MIDWLALAYLALAAWGWHGMVPTVTLAPLTWGIGAASVPDDTHYLTCPITVDQSQVDPGIGWVIVLHEVGHCVGYYGFAWGDHSLDAASVMSGSNDRSATIMPEDFEAVKVNRDMRLPYRVVIPGIDK